MRFGSSLKLNLSVDIGQAYCILIIWKKMLRLLRVATILLKPALKVKAISTRRGEKDLGMMLSILLLLLLCIKKRKKGSSKTSSPKAKFSDVSGTAVYSRKKKAKTPKSKRKKSTKVVLPTDSGRTATKVGGTLKKKVSSTRRISNTEDSDSKARDDANVPELGEVGIKVCTN